MPYIHRLCIKHGEHQSYGYQVRIRRLKISRWFSRKSHGSLTDALTAAVLYRDKKLAAEPR
jgi:hypothetical protein